MVNEYGAIGTYDAATGSITYVAGTLAAAYGYTAEVIANMNPSQGFINQASQIPASVHYVPTVIPVSQYMIEAFPGVGYNCDIYPRDSLQWRQANENLIQAQAKYHALAVASGKSVAHSTIETAADIAVVNNAISYGVTGKSLANVVDNAVASIMHIAEYGLSPATTTQGVPTSTVSPTAQTPATTPASSSANVDIITGGLTKVGGGLVGAIKEYGMYIVIGVVVIIVAAVVMAKTHIGSES